MGNIANQRYSLRDLQLRKDYLNFFQQSDVHCGWMKKQGNTITITDHGIPKRISHADLDKIWGTNFSETFKKTGLLKEDSHRTALFKIKKAESKNKEIRYNEFLMNSVNPVDKRIMANVDAAGAHEGIIVMTGQPSARKDRELYPDKTVKHKGSGKCFEFVFPKENQGKIAQMDAYDDDIYKDFCFIYKDSEDWNYWKKKMEEGASVPVFFSLANGKLIHFGLSYLYKLPYKKRIKDCLTDDHKRNDFDLSECIFGTTQAKDALKGRVQFSHAFKEKGELDREFKAYMGSPKSSYYPIYLRQEGNNGYMETDFTTMMSDKARLKGWKRYPIREGLMQFTIPDGQEDHVNPFVPFKQGSEFKCLVRFHNLRKVEIGALLKAIHFNNRGFHSIGFAKAYGYGAIKIESSLKNCKFSKEDYLSEFASIMQKEVPGYSKSQELRELNLMSEIHKLKTPLAYMELSEFVDCKRQKRNPRTRELEKPGEYLDYYSNLLIPDVQTKAVAKEEEAVVTVADRGIIQAHLLTGKDTQSKDLVFEKVKIKLKRGDRIIVSIVRKGGNVAHLVFKSIIK
jgi:CRISPR-associated protein (TIGR03986 family)